MLKLGIPSSFVEIVRALFTNAEVAVSVNGAVTEPIKIERGIKQGCPLAPFLFLFVGQALNEAPKFQLQLGLLHGIRLPGNQGQQLLVQYADDTNFALQGTQANITAATFLLNQFHFASDLETNWEKA